MRQTFVLSFLAASLCISTQAMAHDRDRCSPERVVKRALAAVGTLDLAQVMPYFSNDVVVNTTGLAPIVGKVQLEAFFGAIFPMYTRFDEDILVIMSEGRNVMATRVEHLALSPYLPIGNAGAAFDLPIAGHFVVKNCKITEWNEYLDTATFARLSGLPLAL